ncbi:putative bifunctional diguanylate cyclase/phosphodiesterase [Aquibacillus kalidii]|uniref:putative bifunctional diguanylate cyclase/phosphodiesterase n=1 Tax=Aquibacillus kalidii TaxID=2762597 RepID=UPI001647E212|nr:EAL domain-containing protein [Aquibacillus kalidii]
MTRFTKLVPRIHKELYLFVALTACTVLSIIFPIQLMYGVSFSFASIFLFLILRLFGLSLAMVIGIVTFLFIPHDFINISSQTILLMELLFVGAFFFRGRSAKMFFVDALYWVTAGLIATFLLHSTYLSGNVLYFQICKDMINGLCNVLIADMLLAYFPFYKLFKRKKLNRNNVSIHQFLSHITVISILVPFFLSVNTNQANNFISSHLVKLAEININQIEEKLSLWDSADIKKALSINGKQRQEIQELVKQSVPEEFDFYLTNKVEYVIASSTAEIPLDERYSWQDNYQINRFSSDILEAIPNEQGTSINRWSEGLYLYETKLDTVSMNIVFQFPIMHYQELIYGSFLGQLKNSLIFALFMIVLVATVSRIFMNNLRQLTIATTGLPQKLHNLENVHWPQSYVSELRILTQNLMVMADKIKELFRDSNKMNKILTEQTNKLKKSEDKLHHLAFYDALTQLPNRLHFQNYVRNMIKMKTTKCFAVIFIDLNQFKQINDTLGHDAGDALLQVTADKLSNLKVAQKREIFRLGGDEFVIVETVTNETDVSASLDKIIQEFANPFVVEEQTLFITSSVGVSMYPRDGKDLDTLVKCADIAMYISKEKGGNVAQFFNESMRNKFQEQLIVENALRQVVDKGCGFELYYQPKMKSCKVTSMEALIRWHHPKLGFVSPGTFIPVAEDIGLILQIDEWSLKQACKQNKAWHDQGLLKVPIAVNISAKHFQQDLLVTLVERVLKETGMDPNYLKLEITESVFIKDPEHVSVVIQKLKSLGVLISIDDFGKGYSSLNHLLELPIDEVKIDRLFIEGINFDEKKALLVNSILDIAQGLDLNVVAEGVETEDEKAKLEELGTVELQGYLFSPPINSQGMEKFLCKRTEVLLGTDDTF